MCGQRKTRAVVPRQEVPGTPLILESPTALYWPQNERKFIIPLISQTTEAQGAEARTPRAKGPPSSYLLNRCKGEMSIAQEPKVGVLLSLQA